MALFRADEADHTRAQVSDFCDTCPESETLGHVPAHDLKRQVPEMIGFSPCIGVRLKLHYVRRGLPGTGGRIKVSSEDEMKQMIRRMWQDDDGQDMVEYALIAGLVSIIAVIAVTAAGQSINTVWTNVSNALAGAA